MSFIVLSAINNLPFCIPSAAVLVKLVVLRNRPPESGQTFFLLSVSFVWSFFLSTALSGIDNSLHDGEAVKRGIISQGIGREFCGNTHIGDNMRKAAGKTPVQ